MKTRSEWLAYFIGLGMDNGTIWHFMAAMYAYGVVLPNGDREAGA